MSFSIMTFSIMMPIIMTFSIIATGIMAFSTMAPSIMTLSKMALDSVILLSVANKPFMLNATMLCVVMLNVMAPLYLLNVYRQNGF